MENTDKHIEKQTKQLKSKRCPKCGFRVGGKNHDQGEHHQHGEHGRMTPSKF